MIRIVAAKLTPYRSFWKFLALQVGAVLLAVYVASSLGNIEVNGAALPIAEWFALPQAWRTICAIARWLYFIPAFFVVQLICAELELRLVRAQVLAGLEHRDVVGGWLLQNAVLTAVAVVATGLAALLFASPAQGGFALESMLRHELGFALYGLIFLSITMLCAVLMRRPVPALALLILWPLAGEPVVSFAMSRYGLEAARSYLPFSTLGTFVAFPSEDMGFDPTDPRTLVGLAYGVVATLLTWLRLQRLDL